MNLLRNPVFATGLVLLVLGVGNWIVAHARLAEVDEQPTTVGTLGNFEEFTELDARTNAELLRPLQRGVAARDAINAKADFYKVVQAGGELFTLVGVGLILFGSAVTWRGTRDGAVAVGPH